MDMNDILDIVKKKARLKRRKIVIAEGWDERCLKAADHVLKEGYADLVLLGDEKKIKEEAKKFKVNITKAEIIDPKASKLREKLAKDLYELRKAKGLTEEQAGKLLDDVNYFGCMLVQTGYADGLAGSAICPTADLMRPALQIIKTKKDATLVSEVIVVDDRKNKRILFISDCSLNIDPDAEQLAQIGVNAADVAHAFGFKPKVSFLSFSTKGSGGDAPVILKSREATKIAQDKRLNYVFEGEMQADASLDPKAAGRKCPGAKVMGDANVLIFPNLVASNIACHLIMKLSESVFGITLLAGIRKPVMILGRSTPQDLVTNLVITAAMEANSEEG
ncbi:phosphate acetyltransferase [Candidatus Woesearchaeota archaeon CG10_big_fil_rev_8_21_14_0_10_44_13]|nr:MAG: phosphate acetyltransferase [Candidatus Woesearchaeota archaeon CG10_big_fil_rev_8_21_14_0_10_44_13]